MKIRRCVTREDNRQIDLIELLSAANKFLGSSFDQIIVNSKVDLYSLFILWRHKIFHVHKVEPSCPILHCSSGDNTAARSVCFRICWTRKADNGAGLISSRGHWPVVSAPNVDTVPSRIPQCLKPF